MICARFIVALSLCSCASAAKKTATAPLAIVEDWGAREVELSSFGPMHAARGPSFVLYASGRVLYSRDELAYLFVALSPEEHAALLTGLPLDRIGQLPPGPVGDDGGWECVAVWAHEGRREHCHWGGVERQPVGRPLDAPPEMAMIWKRLAHFSSPRARPWVNDRIEIVAVPWEKNQRAERCGAPTGAWSWPARWPQPGAHGEEMPLSGWTLVVPASELPELKRMMAARTSRGCVRPVSLRGDAYELSYRQPLP